MPQISKVELYAAIRRDHRDGMKLRAIERKYNLSWRTIRTAPVTARPGRYRPTDKVLAFLARL
ncbi:hypothetical protein ABTZ03_26030 [Kitasatospora sp. NPDC096077]|uniref:hypothetical protein n=1 Tax=Kitasatospora sp. NPDC096077 TaxID=3155544 RepID=UPI00333387E1